MVGEYLMFFQNNTRSKFTIMQKNKLCSFTKLISQKYSDTVVILAIAVFKRCTQDLPVVNTQGSSTGLLFTRKEYFFSGIVDFGVPFSINFHSFSTFLGFRKALDNKTLCPLRLGPVYMEVGDPR